jgi:hypothetical protein
MAFKSDSIPTNFSSIIISIASPDDILAMSHGLDQKPLIIVHINQREMVCFVNVFSVQ